MSRITYWKITKCLKLDEKWFANVPLIQVAYSGLGKADKMRILTKQDSSLDFIHTAYFLSLHCIILRSKCLVCALARISTVRGRVGSKHVTRDHATLASAGTTSVIVLPSTSHDLDDQRSTLTSSNTKQIQSYQHDVL
jgi:hypothetical protein